jgi:hypothetical protein
MRIKQLIFSFLVLILAACGTPSSPDQSKTSVMSCPSHDGTKLQLESGETIRFENGHFTALEVEIDGENGVIYSKVTFWNGQNWEQYVYFKNRMHYWSSTNLKGEDTFFPAGQDSIELRRNNVLIGVFTPKDTFPFKLNCDLPVTIALSTPQP